MPPARDTFVKSSPSRPAIDFARRKQQFLSMVEPSIPEKPEFSRERPGSERALLDLLRGKIDRGDLKTISEADYGMGAEAHFREIERIWSTGDVPAQLRWEPREVLELISYCRPDDPAWRPGTAGIRGHSQRAFVCAVLLRTRFADERFEFVGEEHRELGSLVESCRHLGPDCLVALAEFILWRLGRAFSASPKVRENPNFPLEISFFCLGLALIQTALRRADDAIPLGEILRAVMDWGDEAVRQNSWIGAPRGDQWLLGATLFDLRHDVWRSLALEMFVEGNDALPEDSREIARLIGETLNTPREAERG